MAWPLLVDGGEGVRAEEPVVTLGCFVDLSTLPAEAPLPTLRCAVTACVIRAGDEVGGGEGVMFTSVTAWQNVNSPDSVGSPLAIGHLDAATP